MIAFLLAGAPSAARAQSSSSPEALQAAQDLFSIMSGDILKQLTTQITNAVWPQVEQKARAANIDDATIAELRSEFERIEVGFLTDSLKEAPAIYARHFTAAELHELLSVSDGQQGVGRNAASDGRVLRNDAGPAHDRLAAANQRGDDESITRARLYEIGRLYRSVHSPLNQL
jgi:hypothetical protein